MGSPDSLDIDWDKVSAAVAAAKEREHEIAKQLREDAKEQGK